MLYFFTKLNLSKLPRFLYMNQQLTCNKLRKMDYKSNEFLDSLMVSNPWLVLADLLNWISSEGSSPSDLLL